MVRNKAELEAALAEPRGKGGGHAERFGSVPRLGGAGEAKSKANKANLRHQMTRYSRRIEQAALGKMLANLGSDMMYFCEIQDADEPKDAEALLPLLGSDATFEDSVNPWLASLEHTPFKALVEVYQKDLEEKDDTIKAKMNAPESKAMRGLYGQVNAKDIAGALKAILEQWYPSDMEIFRRLRS